MSLLTGGDRCGCLGKGCHQRFAVSKQRERTTLKEKLQVSEGKVGGEEFQVESGVAGFCRRKFVGKECEWLPTAMCLLLENSANIEEMSLVLLVISQLTTVTS